MIYDLIAPIYDRVNREIDYTAWAAFADAAIRRFYDRADPPELVLDLGCGTGSMTIAMAALGYDMTGIDRSVEMLDIARERALRENTGKSILWLCQDMRSFELYGTVDVTVSTLDCLNHLTTKKDLIKCLSLVHNYLVPDGLFFFDLNGKHKFETVYADRVYCMEEKNSLCIWQNDYSEKTGKCRFGITLFHREKDGRYARYDDTETERMYRKDEVGEMLRTAGFEVLACVKNDRFESATDEDDRLYFIAKCKK